MHSAGVHAVTLVCHPHSRSGVVLGILASTARTPDGVLAITYAIEGDIARMNVPLPRAPRIAHGLWQHTCCECVIALQGNAGYHEFNFAPSGEWAAYAFTKYREGAAFEEEPLHPRIAVRRSDRRLELDATVPLERLSAAHARARLLLALSAVIEDDAGDLPYWALKPPAGRPDFHHRDSCVRQIDSA